MIPTENKTEIDKNIETIQERIDQTIELTRTLNIRMEELSSEFNAALYQIVTMKEEMYDLYKKYFSLLRKSSKEKISSKKNEKRD